MEVATVQTCALQASQWRITIAKSASARTLAVQMIAIQVSRCHSGASSFCDSMVALVDFTPKYPVGPAGVRKDDRHYDAYSN